MRVRLSISIHAPTRGATYLLHSLHTQYIFQSTLPREERQTISIDTSEDFKISIHAPTRGATNIIKKSSNPNVFQSTLPREERLSQTETFHHMILFQSTLPREERPGHVEHDGNEAIFQSTLPREERHDAFCAEAV